MMLVSCEGRKPLIPLSTAEVTATAKAHTPTPGQPSTASLTRTPENGFDCRQVGEIPRAECEALVTIYNSTDGVNWINNAGWLKINTPCKWYGVTCESGKVTALKLVENNLAGNIPEAVGDLSALMRLDFFRNPDLEGTVPASLVGLDELQFLRIHETNISGEIPTWLSELDQLRTLDLGFNNLSGEIPPTLESLSQLTELNLGGNKMLTGAIPPELGSLINLEYLHLDRCQLNGIIPHELGDLQNLKLLHLHWNQLVDEIPSSITQLTKLTELDVSHNALSATDPAMVDFLNGKDPDWQATQRILSADASPDLLDNLRIDDVWFHPQDEATYVYVPAGKFIMGSSVHQINTAEDLCQEYAVESAKCPGQFRSEAGQNTVYADGFWIMQTEVTNQQYSAFINDGGYTQRQYWSDAGWAWRTEQNISAPRYFGDTDFRGGYKPVVGMSWYEAEAYTRWLSIKSGREFRLPTEAEWEKAARGTDGRIFPWGNEWDESRGQRLNYCDANCCDNNPDRCRVQDNISDGYLWTAPGGSYPLGASPYGALDMAGNVSEWVADWYAEDAYAASATEIALGPENGDLRVVRGGAWMVVQPDFLRVTMRARDYPDNHRADRPDGRLNGLGFRVVTSVL